jgi:ABC-type amino acid transport substrate-binding protein
LYLFVQVFWVVTVPSVLAQDTTTTRLIVMGDKDYPPYESLVDGEPVGINVDLWREIAKILGRPLDLRLYQ